MLTTNEQAALDTRRRPVRVLALLDSLARAGIEPVPLRVLHELAYLANVLAPVFDLVPFSASLLKRANGPYYPELQVTVDSMVGKCMVDVTDIQCMQDEDDGGHRLDAHYRLNYELSRASIEAYREVYAGSSELFFIDELAAAYSMLSDEQMGHAAREDARYGDDHVDTNDVIDFGQWNNARQANFSTNAALSFRPGKNLAPAERLYMYMAHMQERAIHG